MAPKSTRPWTWTSSRRYQPRTSPITRWLTPSSAWMACQSWHSKATGEPLTRGAPTHVDASGSTPAISNSSSSGSNSMALSWTAATWAMVAMLTTNSPVSRMLTKVSFSVSLSERGWMDSEIGAAYGRRR